ncbi:MAG: ferritin-like domain-containing protein [Bacteroidia bacterium]
MKSTLEKSAQSGTKKATVSDKKNQSDTEKGLCGLFENELKDIYWAEKALTKAIPKMIKKATSQELKDALTDHLDVTTGQVSRLEEVFEIIGVKAQAKKCEAMEGIIKEAGEIMDESEEGVVRDAGIISAAQKVEHYEIATYGTLVAFAKTLGKDDAASLLEETLKEEKEADETLSGIADTINAEAADEDEENEEHDVEDDDDGDVQTAVRKKKK